MIKIGKKRNESSEENEDGEEFNEDVKKNSGEKIFIFFIAALTIIYVVVFIIPESSTSFSLDPSRIHQEGWRFLTYQFAHLNLDHLSKNLIAFSLVAWLAIELKASFADFSSTYLLSGFLAVIPLWLALQFTALGASVAIYGAFGLICFEASKLDKKLFFLAVGIIGIILVESLFLFASGQTKVFVFTQASSHFSGLVFGGMFFFCLGKTKSLISKKKNFCLRR